VCTGVGLGMGLGMGWAPERIHVDDLVLLGWLAGVWQGLAATYRSGREGHCVTLGHGLAAWSIMPTAGDHGSRAASRAA
jgi:hypothetical protein